MIKASGPEHVLRVVERISQIEPYRIALIDEKREITYGQLMTEILNTQSLLTDIYGIKKRDRVGILLENNIDCVIALLAILRTGAIAVIINTKLTRPEVEWILEDSSPVLVMIGHEDFRQLINEKLPILEITSEHPLSQSDEEPLSNYHDEDPALIMYTSGTTGRPKGAMITHHNITYAVNSYIETLQLTERESTLIMVPMFYITGLSAQLMVFLSLGSKIALLRRFNEHDALRLIEKHRITHIHSVSTIYLRLLNGMNQKDYELTCLRQALCGGGPITTTLIKHIKAHLPWLDFRRIYGLTETTSPGTIMPVDVDKMPDKDFSSGLPMKWMQVKIVDDNGLEVNRGEPGELLIKGENVIKQYWNNPTANKESFVDDWFKTGDIARMDEDGFVYILDRKKDMINRAGEKIYSSEVENVLAQYPGVKEVAVVGIPDSYYGEIVKAYIVPEVNGRLIVDNIIQFAGKQLAKYKVPARIEFIEELPRNAAGKILKSALRERIE